jgi:hypothetical protein
MDDIKISWNRACKEGFTTIQLQGLVNFPHSFSVAGVNFSLWDVGDPRPEAKLYRSEDGRSILLRDATALPSGW